MGESQVVDEIRRSYSILGVPSTASKEEIRQRYLRLVKQWHPDKWGSDPVAQWRATEKMKALNDAYAHIKDAPLLAYRSAGADTIDPASSTNFIVTFASDRLTSKLLIAGWLGIGLGLYAFGDSLLALFGVSLIRDSGARLDDIRQISRYRLPGNEAYAWQSWIVSFGNAAERVLWLRALVGLVTAYTGLAVLRQRSWAQAVLAVACVVAIVCGVIGLSSLLRWSGVRYTSVPLEAILLAAVATYVLRLLVTSGPRRL